MQDNLCLKCRVRGICCFEEAVIKGIRVITEHPCKFLTKKGKCKVYRNRYQRRKDCLPIEKMIEFGTVPIECLYVKDKEYYSKRKDRRYYHFKIKVTNGI